MRYQQDIIRHRDGSINYAFYLQRSRNCRSVEAHQATASCRRFIRGWAHRIWRAVFGSQGQSRPVENTVVRSRHDHRRDHREIVPLRTSPFVSAPLSSAANHEDINAEVQFLQRLQRGLSPLDT